MIELKKHCSIQTIGFDKVNQLRHVKFLKSVENLKAHMREHAKLIKPKFDIVLNILKSEIGDLGLAKWIEPNGGYFISLNTINGCAKRTINLCAQAGVKFTPAGATYPYGVDPNDSNIRIAPTYPSEAELEISMRVFCVCLKISCIEHILKNK